MPTNGGSVFSETLRDVTNIKLEELSKKRSEFEATKKNVLSHLEEESDPLARLGLLSQGVKDCFGIKTTKTGEMLSGPSKNPDLELALKNLDSFMAQSKYDPSITPQLMRSWEESLLRRLGEQSSKLEFASLYAQLVTEWLSTEKAAPDADLEDVDMAGAYEDVGDSMKKEARHGWEKLVFESAGVNEKALKSYLLDLFGLQDPNNPAKAKAMKQLREKLTEFENSLAAPKQFNPATLTWVINGLLASDLLTDERREVLRDFLGNPTILTEVADVLDMRLAALSTWSWGESVALEQQRRINGVFNILMHEDVLQAIFLHYIGTKWSVFLKNALKQFRKFDGAWKSPVRFIPPREHERRSYYLGPHYMQRRSSVSAARHNIYRNHYFMANLMSRENQKQSSLEGEVEANYSVQTESLMYRQAPMPMQAPALKRTLARHAPIQAAPMPRGMSTYDPEDDSFDDSGEDKRDRNPMEDKQRLIRLLSAEIAIGRELHGEFTALHSVFEGWYSLLPHETILTVMALLGTSETWIAFFAKFLRAPLKFLDDSPTTQPRIRLRGTPSSHALSEIFSESILFCLDFAVNQATEGHNLHRMHDDFWFWSSDHDVAKTAWDAVSNFVTATRTYIDFGKSGTVHISRNPSTKLAINESLPAGDIRWGFLKLSTQTGQFEIDQGMVDKHIVDLRRQLADKRKSVISFIQTWNTFAATFFTSNFGKPANCFGRTHVDQILATHQRIQREVFASSPSSPSPLLAGEAQPREPIMGVVEYVKHVLRTRFGVSDIPDAYLFFPMELGGLDLRSPFVSILPVREAVVEDPKTLLATFLEAERDDYARNKLAFERGDRRYTTRVPEELKGLDEQPFMAFEEYTRYREDLAYDFQDNLASVFKRLLEVPAAEGGIRTASAAVRAGIEDLAASSHGLKGITGHWHSMDAYWRWIAQLYGPEAITRFGGLNIVEHGLLPMGMVSIFRDKRVKWQG